MCRSYHARRYKILRDNEVPQREAKGITLGWTNILKVNDISVFISRSDLATVPPEKDRGYSRSTNPKILLFSYASIKILSILRRGSAAPHSS